MKESKLHKINMLEKAGALALDSQDSRIFKVLCRQLSLDVATACKAAGSGHLGGALSSVELMATLYLGGHLQLSTDNPRHEDRDRVLLRGHLGSLCYPLFSLFGWGKDEELPTYRRLNSRLQGHESMQDLPGVDITPSGSLGCMPDMYAMAHSISVTDPSAHIHINAAEAFIYRALGQLNSAGQGESHIVITADKSGLSELVKHFGFDTDTLVQDVVNLCKVSIPTIDKKNDFYTTAIGNTRVEVGKDSDVVIYTEKDVQVKIPAPANNADTGDLREKFNGVSVNGVKIELTQGGDFVVYTNGKVKIRSPHGQAGR